MPSPLLYFEDLSPETRLESEPYLVERDEIIEFARRWDPLDFHLDEEAAKRHAFGGLTACAAHTTAIQSILAHRQPGLFAVIAGLGNDGMKLANPVRPGDELRLVTRCLEVRASNSRPEAGIVRCDYSLLNQRDEVVMQTTGNVMVARRPSR